VGGRESSPESIRGWSGVQLSPWHHFTIPGTVCPANEQMVVEPMKKTELEEREQEMVWAFLGQRRTGFFVEVGANDPKVLSQTWHLEAKGWRGILVEPNPTCAEALRQQRKNSTVFQVACSSPENSGDALFHFSKSSALSGLQKHVDDPRIEYDHSEPVHVTTLDAILEKAGNPHIDFISIDVEGTELDVLKGFDLGKHRPSLILLEDKVHDLQKHCFLKTKGYKLIRRTRVNNWYIPKDVPYSATSWMQRLKLFRKMYLGTPWRKLMLKSKRYRKRQLQQ